MSLTIADITKGYDDTRWGGWGYLGARDQYADRSDPEIVAERGTAVEIQTAIARADAVVLKLANEQGWDAEQLFAWLNCRMGRHYGDMAFEKWTEAEIEETARKWEIVTTKAVGQ